MTRDFRDFPREWAAVAREQMEADRQAGFPAALVTGEKYAGAPLATPIPPERIPLDEKAAELIVGMVFQSKSEGVPHVVTIRRDPGYPPTVTCICAAMRNIESRPSGCWGMVAARNIAGFHQP